jgi:hypothetical protein
VCRRLKIHCGRFGANYRRIEKLEDFQYPSDRSLGRLQAPAHWPRLAGPGYHINRSNLLVLDSKADMQKRGHASPDHGDALALTFAQPVDPAEVEEKDEEEEFGRYSGSSNSGWMR